MRSVAKIVVLLLLSCLVVAAQEITGSITGVITDTSGAVVIGADVSVTNVDQNKVIRQLKTNGSGRYVAALLPVGHYSVKVAAPKYRTFESRGVMLNVSDRLSVNAELKPGSVTESVQVSADAIQVQSQDATAQGLINGTQVRELSLSQRNYEEMVALVPGVSSAVSDTIYAGVETPGGGTNQVSFSINGTRFSQNNWTIDGVDNVDRGGNFSLLNYPSVDAIEEFKVLRSLYSPEYGRGAGGQIAVITRSGTNKLHGGVY